MIGRDDTKTGVWALKRDGVCGSGSGQLVQTQSQSQKGLSPAPDSAILYARTNRKTPRARHFRQGTSTTPTTHDPRPTAAPDRTRSTYTSTCTRGTRVRLQFFKSCSAELRKTTERYPSPRSHKWPSRTAGAATRGRLAPSASPPVLSHRRRAAAAASRRSHTVHSSS